MQKVLGILGPSYSGSTALGYLMNTSKKVFFASELKRLFEGDGARTVCAICGEGCDFWTRGFKQILVDRGPCAAYRLVGEKSKASLVVDGSKMPYFFRKSLSDYGESDCAFLVAKKHPLRLLASYFYNVYLKKKNLDLWKNGSLKDIRASQNELWAEFHQENMNPILGRLWEVYSSIYGFIDKKRVPSLDVRHEDVEEPEFVGSVEDAVYDFFGVSFSLSRTSLTSDFCHPLGGNKAPLWNALGGSNLESRVEVGRWRYYRESKGLVRDDKCFVLFEDHHVMEVKSSDKYKALCELLGYSVDVR